MRVLVKKGLIYSLCVSLLALTAPARGNAGERLPEGRRTAAEAAATAFGGRDSRRAGRLLAAFAYADTTEYEFPDEEEEERNVVKEVILWTAVAGFLSFFVIKVFLQGDTDIPPPEPNKKPPPPPPTVSGRSPQGFPR
ncbi:MAG: hypothetical protein ACE5EO_07585 [Candidatus Krumholzibacteriia bacterium]